jgi:hypothetical protein
MRKSAILILLMMITLVAAVSLVTAERLPDSEHGGRGFTTTLTGAAEAPGPGDPDGTGTATVTLNVGQREVCWEIHVSGITLPATAAHIHVAPVGVPGPIVVGLGAPDANGNSTGCVSGVDRDLLRAILHDPSAYYVNVHNADFPAGAVRGQLFR